MLKENKEINETLEFLKEGMISFMKHASYTTEDVQACIDLLLEYLYEVEKTSSKEAFLDIVKKTVLKLNDLNEKLDHELIETDQREDLAEIIMLAGSLKGYIDRDDDVTEEWRDW